jgi:hypothetical protein
VRDLWGGTLSVVSRCHGRKRAYFYGCLAHAKRGATVCDNAIDVDRQAVERRVLEQVKAWQALLTANVPDARQALREVLDGPIRFTPDGKQYRFSGIDTTKKLIAGLVGLRLHPYMASPTGNGDTYWELPIVGDTRRAA